MDLIRTMFKPKSSMSPAKSIDTSYANSSVTSSIKKRKHDHSPALFTTNGNGDSTMTRPIKTPKLSPTHRNPGKTSSNSSGNSSSNNSNSNNIKRQGFTFEEVKSLLDSLLGQDKKLLDLSVNVGVKNIDFSSSGLVVPGHRGEECKELIDKLVHNTRRIRTVEEVLQDIKTNLNKRSYTDIILQSSCGEPPKRPPSAYLMFHQKRFKELQDEGETLAANVAKIVSEEWKYMSDEDKEPYLRQHDEELRAYEENIQRMGLGKVKKPTRPMSAKVMFVRSKLAQLKRKDNLSKDKLDKKKNQFKDEFEASPALRDEWTKKYNAERKRYEEERAKFVEDNPHLDSDDIIKPRSLKSKVKPPEAPKNALKLYLEKKLPDGLEGQELKDKEAKLRAKFEKMSTERQLKYIKKALREKERYETELEEFVQEYPDLKVPQHKPNVTKEQWRLYQQFVEGRPQMPAPTPYLHFCSTHIRKQDENEDSDNLDQTKTAPTKRLRDASRAWKELSSNEAKVTQVQEDHLNHIRAYINEMEQWLANQDDKRIEQLFQEDPKSKPDYWRKRIPKIQRSNKKSLIQKIKCENDKSSRSSNADSD